MRSIVPGNTTTFIKPTTLEYSLKFDFESDFDIFRNHAWLQNNFYITLVYSLLYITIVFGGPFLMKTKKPFELLPLLTLWNCFLAVFSIAGTIRTLPELIYVLTEFGFSYSVCNSSYVTDNSVTAYWAWKFGISKIWEFGDTIFIVLRKRDLIFLHWYHHLSVLVTCAYGGLELIAPGRWYMVMNYFVHSFMYTYFAFRSMKFHIPKRIAMLVTVLQISQMLLGGYVSWWAYNAKLTGQHCQISKGLAASLLTVYITFFILFSKLFYESYFCQVATRTVKKKEN